MISGPKDHRILLARQTLGDIQAAHQLNFAPPVWVAPVAAERLIRLDARVNMILNGDLYSQLANPQGKAVASLEPWTDSEGRPRMRVLFAHGQIEEALAGHRKGRKVEIGDVFQIPIDDTRVGYGQVIARRLSTYLVATFASAYPRDHTAPASSIVKDKLAFLAEALDAKIWNGDWPVVANIQPDASRMRLPNYKVSYGSANNVHVEAYDGKRHRPARPREIEILRYREVLSAMMVQCAFQAFHQATPWEERYRAVLDEDYCLRSAEIRPSGFVLPKWRNLWDRRTSKAEEPGKRLDETTLSQLQAAGANLSKPTEVINYIYFHHERNAKEASAQLLTAGYTVEGPSKGSQGFVVVAKGQLIPSTDNIASMRRAMEAIAREFRGDYDGWEAAVTL